MGQQKDNWYTRLGPVGRVLFLAVLAAVVCAISYWGQAQFGISLFSRHGSTKDGPTSFEWSGFLGRAGFGAVLGLILGAFSEVRKRIRDKKD